MAVAGPAAGPLPQVHQKAQRRACEPGKGAAKQFSFFPRSSLPVYHAAEHALGHFRRTQEASKHGNAASYRTLTSSACLHGEEFFCVQALSIAASLQT